MTDEAERLALAERPTDDELLYLADQQAHMRAQYSEHDSGLIRESRVIEWALRVAATGKR